VRPGAAQALLLKPWLKISEVFGLLAFEEASHVPDVIRWVVFHEEMGAPVLLCFMVEADLEQVAFEFPASMRWAISNWPAFSEVCECYLVAIW
jgi:hypothetical protein